MPGRYNDAPEVLPLPNEGRGSLQYWRDEIKAAIERQKQFLPDWNRNLASYRTKSILGGQSALQQDTIVVPRDFSNVEQKASQLFFQVPDVHLTAKQPMQADAVQSFQAVLNHYLSEDEVDALGLMNDVLFDALCPAGLMCSKIGYESFEDGVEPMVVGEKPAEVQPPPAEVQPGAVLGLSGPAAAPVMEPIIEDVPNIVHERYFWSRLSPAQVLIPWNFRSTKYDRAPFLGYRFEDDWTTIRAAYNLADEKPPKRSTSEDDLYLEGEPNKQSGAGYSNKDRVTGVELWYYTSQYDPTVAHPEKMRQLVLLDGLDNPLIHRDSPYQTEGPNGEVIGLLGNPVHIGALRTVSDTAYPPSECTIGRSLVEELNLSRQQMLLQRDRSIPIRLADKQKLGVDGLQKLERNVYQSVIPVDNLDPNNPGIVPVALAAYPRENFGFHDYIDRDNKDVWAMGDNQRGQESAERRTATEQAIVEKSSNARLDKERRAALRYFIAGVRKIGALIQKFGSPQDLVPVIGPDQVSRLQQWNREQIQGKFVYWARPDSAIRLDQAEARTQALKLYELLAKDPNVNRVQLLVEISRQYNIDPQSLVVPQLPEKGPDPAAVTFRFTAADLDPTLANFPITMAILTQSGYKIPPGLIEESKARASQQSQIMNAAGGVSAPAGNGTGARPQPSLPSGTPDREHGGTAPLADHVNKHRADDKNERPGQKPLVQ